MISFKRILSKFNQNTWLELYNDVNDDLRRKAKNDFERDFLKLINNAVFEKTMENLRKNRDIKLSQQKEKNCLVSEPNYHTATAKPFTQNLLAIEMKKEETHKNKSVHLGLSILELSRILMFEFWYDYLKPVFGEKVKLCYMDIDRFNVYIKTCDINKDVAEVVEIRFYTSNYELDRPLPKRKIKRLIWLMKVKLGGKLMTKFAGLIEKNHRKLLK